MKKKDIITEYILNNINKGTWKPGKRILSEADIAKYNNISRNTVREAILSLVDKNILEHRRGSGTYVKINDKKYIIVLYHTFFFKEIIGTYYRIIIEKVINKLENLEYIPLLVEIGKEQEYLNINKKDISAIIKMIQLPSILDSIAKEDNIPIIEFGDNNTPFSSVKEETVLSFIYLKNLIEKYNFKNPLIFSKNFVNNLDHIAISIYTMYNYYFKEQGWTVYKINVTPNLDNVSSIIHNALESINTIPDVIIFLDDNIYKCGYEIYPLFDKLLKQTKIITFSNGNEKYNPQYKICKLQMDLEEIAQAIFDLTISNINQEFKTVKNAIIKPKIIDEDSLA